jgi:hypothetical protein
MRTTCNQQTTTNVQTTDQAPLSARLHALAEEESSSMKHLQFNEGIASAKHIAQ